MAEKYNGTDNGVFGATEKSTGHSVFGRLDQYQDSQERLKWEGSFSEYMDKVVENPNAARSAHTTLYQAFSTHPDYFTSGENALYGAEAELEQLNEFLRAGDEGLQLGKRIMLLVGGPGSGKSTIVRGLKELLQEYSKTDEGALYGIQDCELHEEPLHLIPQELRAELEQELGVKIEGDLCEACKLRYGGTDNLSNVANVPIERVFLSARDSVGISSFEPSDTKSQDISELIGEVDLSKLGEVGVMTDPRAYRFNGAFHKANRGMLELVELLKNDEKFMYAFLSAAQERQVKSKSFPYTSIDEVLIAHTNLSEYYKYMHNPDNEAIRDRTTTIWWKYPLRVSEEKQVYAKLIEEGKLVREKKVHINPNSIETAANFSVMSRLKQSKNAGYSKIQKMKIYDGQDVEGLTNKDFRELSTEFRDEGLTGVSPRFVIDSLSSEIVKEGKICLTPISTTKALRKNIDRHPHTREMSDDVKAELLADLDAAEMLYAEKALDEIKSAYLGSREEEISAYVDKYLQNVVAFCSHTKIKDEFNEDGAEPDEQFMRSIEGYLSVSESGKAEYRSTLLAQIMNERMSGKEFNYKSMPKLERAVLEKFFATTKDAIRLVTTAQVPDARQKKHIDKMLESLIDERGYCTECASELVRYASTLLNSKN